MTDQITIEAFVPTTPQAAFDAYTTPEDIMQWNFASPDWCCPRAEVDLRNGGALSFRMEARDGSMGFDFAGTYEEVDAPGGVTIKLDDGRLSRTTFEDEGDGTRVRTVFEPEATNPVEMQRAGWQAILDNFAAHVAATRS